MFLQLWVNYLYFYYRFRKYTSQSLPGFHPLYLSLILIQVHRMSCYSFLFLCLIEDFYVVAWVTSHLLYYCCVIYPTVVTHKPLWPPSPLTFLQKYPQFSVFLTATSQYLSPAVGIVATSNCPQMSQKPAGFRPSFNLFRVQVCPIFPSMSCAVMLDTESHFVGSQWKLYQLSNPVLDESKYSSMFSGDVELISVFEPLSGALCYCEVKINTQLN